VIQGSRQVPDGTVFSRLVRLAGKLATRSAGGTLVEEDWAEDVRHEVACCE
jgi:hypothetical protein